MAAETGSFESASGEDAFYRVWRAAEPKAALILVHGIGEHSGRYDHVGSYLAERGVTVYALDHQGHGRSGGRRGWVSDFNIYLDDIANFDAYVRIENESRPLFLLGHSMGGLLVVAYLLERPLKPDYVILSGPAIVPILDPDAPAIDPTRLSRDPLVQEAYMADPLILRERIDDELYLRLADCLAVIDGRAGEISLPLLLLHGTDDRLCSAQGAKDFVEASASKDTTIRLYADGRHESFNEVNREEVLADLWAWMEPRCGAGSAG
jgi:alpha-beta hydrolase superfamily lysophospholipase